MPKTKVRIFLDTNVIFSGLYSSNGAPGTILTLFIEGRINVVISQQVLDELILTLKEKLPSGLPILKMLLVNAPPEIVPDPALAEIRELPAVIPVADTAILTAAIGAKPDYFVTGDNHFLENLPLLENTGIKILSPAQFLKIFR